MLGWRYLEDKNTGKLFEDGKKTELGYEKQMLGQKIIFVVQSFINQLAAAHLSSIFEGIWKGIK